MRRAVLILLTTMSIAAVSAPVAGQSSDEAREPDALAALERMGASLRDLQSFSVSTDVTYEDVLTSGQKIQYGGTIDMKVRRPDGFFVEAVSDRQARTLVYDGKTLTLYAPRLGYYAKVDAPPTIAETVAEASEELALEVPLADLFAWGTDPQLLARVQSAFLVGGEAVAGTQCTHYAVRQEFVDWQIWIRDGDQALPCKLVITSTDDPAMPQYTVRYTWTPQEAHPASTFAFAPAEGDSEIEFVTIEAATVASAEER